MKPNQLQRKVNRKLKVTDLSLVVTVTSFNHLAGLLKGCKYYIIHIDWNVSFQKHP